MTDTRLQGIVAIITGGSRGLGREQDFVQVPEKLGIFILVLAMGLVAGGGSVSLWRS